jgi:hypothetical protein
MADLIDDQLAKQLDQDILEIIGGKDLQQEKKDELYERMAKTVQNRSIVRVYDLLNEDERNQLDELLEANDNNRLNEFFKSHNIDLAKILLEEAIVYKTEMIELYKMAKQDKTQVNKE